MSKNSLKAMFVVLGLNLLNPIATKSSDDLSTDQPVLLVVHQTSTLFESEDTKATKLRAETVVLGIRRGKYGPESRLGWQITTFGKPAKSGWVDIGAVTPFEAMAAEFSARGIKLGNLNTRIQQPATTPELILIQKNPVIREAWQEVADIIKENEALPEKERLPDPYFARAEIWDAVGNYSDALSDYLKGIKTARLAGHDLLTYSAFFDKLASVASKFDAVPQAPLGGDANLPSAARKQFMFGYHDFVKCHFQDALNYFDNAVQLRPDQPLYWYFRALTHRMLKDHEKAQHDALMGAYFERNTAAWRQRHLNWDFNRIQGPLRFWLESYRIGSPNQRLLQTTSIKTNRNKDG